MGASALACLNMRASVVELEQNPSMHVRRTDDIVCSHTFIAAVDAAFRLSQIPCRQCLAKGKAAWLGGVTTRQKRRVLSEQDVLTAVK
eukprot:5090423-Pleurochrysis_carterae.AAC.2